MIYSLLKCRVFYPLFMLFLFSQELCAQESIKTKTESLMANEQYELAISALIDVNSRHPDSIAVWIESASKLCSGLIKSKNFHLTGELKDYLLARDYIDGVKPEKLAALSISIGLSMLYKGEIMSAITFAGQMLERLEKQPDFINSLAHGKLYVHMGDLYYNRNEMKKADAYYKIAMPIYERFSDNENVLLNYYYRVASMERIKHNYDLSKAMFEKMVHIFEQQYKPDLVFLASVYNSIAINHFELEEYQKTIEMNEKAIQVYESGGFGAGQIANYLNLHVAAFYGQKQYDSAVHYAHKALLYNSMTYRPRLTEHLALAHHYSKKADSAYYYIDKYIAYNQDNDYYASRGWLHKATFYLDNGELHKALETCNKAFAVMDSSWVQEDLLAIPDLLDSEIKEYSITLIRKKLDIKSAILYQEKDVEKMRKGLLDLEKDYEHLLQMIRLYLMNINHERSRASIYKSRLSSIEGYLKLMLRLQENGINDHIEEKIFTIFEVNKVLELQRQKQELTNRIDHGVPDSLVLLNKNLKVKKLTYEQKLEVEELKSYQEVFNDSLLAINQNIKDLNAYLKQQYPDYLDMRISDNAVNMSEWQQKLTDTKVTLSFFYTNERLYGLLIGADYARYKVIGEKDSINDCLTKMYQIISRPPHITNLPRTVEEYQTQAYGLYQLLIEPFEADLRDAKTIMIFPDGELNLLPFECLISSRQNNKQDFRDLQYLLNRYDFQYAYSAALLSEVHMHKQLKSQGVLAFGYSSPAQSFWLADAKKMERDNWDELPGTGKEVQTLSKLLKGKFYLDATATESQFKLEAENFEMLHLAVHGKANLYSPYNSSLHFKTEQDSLNDGVLYAYELLNIPLRAKLVVLSACETGFGKILAGEGVYSMARAFHYAGSTSQIVSFWKANDQYTADLMIGFYQHFLNNNSTHYEALTIAKRDFVDNADGLSAHPYYWAAFVAMGEGVSYTKSYIDSIAMLLGVLILVLGIFGYYWKKKQ